MRAWLLTPVALVIFGFSAGEAPAVSLDIKTTETMMEAQAADSAFLGLIFGVDLSASIEYSSFVDPASGKFTYSTLADQMYLNTPLFLSSSGHYESSALRYDWTTSGTIGVSTWQTNGHLTWASDSTGSGITALDESDSDVGTGDVILVRGDGTYLFNAIETKITKGKNGDRNKSRVTYAIVVYKDGVNSDPSDFYFAKGADTLIKDGKWRHRFKIGNFPVTFTANGASPLPLGGNGAFQTGVSEIASVPVPAAGVILAGGIGLLGLLRRNVWPSSAS